MDEDRMGGLADKAAGHVKSALGDVTGDTRLRAEGEADKASGSVRNAVGGAKDAIRDVAGEVSHKATEYGRDAREAVVAGVEGASSVVRGYPLATVGLVAVLAFLVGRVTTPQPKHWYQRDWF